MAVRINLNEARLLQYHEDQMDEVLLLFHTYPTSIPNYSITKSELAEMSEFDAMGRELAAGLPRLARGRKQTIFHRDPDFCNGLPRRSR
jgi:hypothetical protein